VDEWHSNVEIEAALSAFPGLGGIAVTEYAWTHPGTCLVAYVAPVGVDVAALSAHARQRLPGHLVPAAIIAVDSIPVAPGGAIDPAELPAPNLSGLMPYRAPETPRQRILCDVFAEVLRVPRVGLDDDFFSLGGRSIDAMLLAGRITAAMDMSVAIVDLFDAPSVAELDQRLADQGESR
jgi:hypothetical protein